MNLSPRCRPCVSSFQYRFEISLFHSANSQAFWDPGMTYCCTVFYTPHIPVSPLVQREVQFQLLHFATGFLLPDFFFYIIQLYTGCDILSSFFSFYLSETLCIQQNALILSVPLDEFRQMDPLVYSHYHQDIKYFYHPPKFLGSLCSIPTL